MLAGRNTMSGLICKPNRSASGRPRRQDSTVLWRVSRGSPHRWTTLTRLWIYELVLGFPWTLEGLWLDAYGRLRLVSSQPFMPGVPATDEQIHEYLDSRGFFLQEDHFMGPMWVHADFEVVVGDAYPDNFVVLEDGSVMPVDLSIARYHF